MNNRTLLDNINSALKKIPLKAHKHIIILNYHVQHDE